MSGLAFELSDAAMAAVFSSGGVLAAVAAQWANGRKNKTPTLEGCEKFQKKNEEAHDKFLVSIGLLEGEQKVSRAMVKSTEDRLERIEDKIDRVIEHMR